MSEKRITREQLELLSWGSASARAIFLRVSAENPDADGEALANAMAIRIAAESVAQEEHAHQRTMVSEARLVGERDEAIQRAELAESALANERGNHLAFRAANEQAVQRARAAEETLARALVLEESDRQLVLLALAVLSLESPGFDDALNRVAVRIDNIVEGRGVMYESFRSSRVRGRPPLGTIEHAAGCTGECRMVAHGDNPDAPPNACRAWPRPATIGGRPYNE
jgi:hypothetical protein